jgi:hypothetical protein
MLLHNHGNKLVLQINQLRLHLQSALRASRHALAATIAFLSVNNDVEFA